METIWKRVNWITMPSLVCPGLLTFWLLLRGGKLAGGDLLFFSVVAAVFGMGFWLFVKAVMPGKGASGLVPDSQNSILMGGMGLILGVFGVAVSSMVTTWPPSALSAYGGAMNVLRLSFAPGVVLVIAWAFWPRRKTGEDAILVVNGKPYGPGERFNLWLAPILKYRIEELRKEVPVSLASVLLHFRDGEYRVQIQTSVKVRMEVVARNKLSNFRQELFESTVVAWLVLTVLNQAPNYTVGELGFGKAHMVDNTSCIDDAVPIMWDGRLKILPLE